MINSRRVATDDNTGREFEADAIGRVVRLATPTTDMYVLSQAQSERT